MPFSVYESGITRTVEPVRDIAEMISRLDWEDTPIVSSIGMQSTNQIRFEWQTDTLGTADANNSMPQGGDAPEAVDTLRVLQDNYTQMFNETVSVNSTQQAVKQYGLSNEFAYQRAKKTALIKQHSEKRVISDGTKQAPTATNGDIGLMDGVCTQITTNVDSSGTFSQATFDTLMQTVFDAGGKPKDVWADATRKQAISNFTGSDRRATQDAKRVINTVEVYQSDFGEVRVHYHRLLPVTVNSSSNDSECLLLDHSLLEMRTLEPMLWELMGKTGKSRTELGTWDVTLANRNQLGHAIYTGL